MISTRGRYTLRVLADLAIHREKGFIPMREVAMRQEISLKYLEHILPVLKKNNLVLATSGKGGGYRLAREPEAYTVGEILRLTEVDLAPVACMRGGANGCTRAETCLTLPMWRKLRDLVNDYFDGITLADLIGREAMGPLREAE